MSRDYYKILLVAPSGYGKTYSARNLDRSTTGFINAENKPLPFKEGFKNMVKPKNLSDITQQLIEFGKNPEITSIYLDSISAVFDMLLMDARSKYKNFDVWNYYNAEIQKLIDLIKKVPKEVFISAHYEILGIEGNQEKRVKVKGKELEGMIEKDFTIVLYADKRVNDKGKMEYSFNLNQENTSCKCPPDIFGDDTTKIPNDCNLILAKIKEFVGEVTMSKVA